MTREEAQIVLMRAFVATGELPDDIAALLNALLRLTAARECAVFAP